MKKSIAIVPLTNSDLYAIVDQSDYELVSKYRWRLLEQKRDGYSNRFAVTTVNGTTIYMHRLITECPKGLVVDHIDGRQLYSRRHNLRVCTISENLKNRHH